MATDNQTSQTEYINPKWSEMIRDLVDVDGLYTDVALESLYHEGTLTEVLAQDLAYNVNDTAIAELTQSPRKIRAPNQLPNLPSLTRGYIEVLN